MQLHSDCSDVQFWFLCHVSKFRAFVKFWLPPLILMAVIFTASSDTHSYQHSSRLIEPLLRWLFPHMSQQHVGDIVLVARKCAHLTEYALFAILLWRAFRQPMKNDPRPWSWRPAILALFIVLCYAASDEYHQRFVPTRTAHFTDVLIDTTGGALGLFVIWGIGRWRKRW